METTFVRHEACPNCGSRDNLGVWSDGHKWCFGCGYYIPSSNSVRNERLGKILHDEVVETGVQHPVLPSDADIWIPAMARLWLAKYQLTELELIVHKLLWSEKKQYLIFPYFDTYNNLLGWQGRYFGDNKDHPKWIGRGNLKKIYHVLPTRKEYDTIVVVEDIVSAIKVSRHIPAMPLFGCSFGRERAYRLSKLSHMVRIWLDPDKRKEAVREAVKASRMGLHCNVILADKDPKEFTDEEIKNLLTI